MNYDDIKGKCPNVIFTPFIGDNYGKEGAIFKDNKKLLILGESFYCNDRLKKCHCNDCLIENAIKHGCVNWYIELVKDWHIKARKEGKNITCVKGFLSCEKAYFNIRPSHEEREKFWNSCCFYNFFTEPQIGPLKDLKLQKETYARSIEAFNELINYLRPDAVICWSRRTYDKLPTYGHKENNIETEHITASVWFYPFKDGNGGTKVLCHSPHPSLPRGNSFSKWHLVYKKFLSDFY